MLNYITSPVPYKAKQTPDKGAVPVKAPPIVAHLETIEIATTAPFRLSALIRAIRNATDEDASTNKVAKTVEYMAQDIMYSAKGLTQLDINNLRY